MIYNPEFYESLHDILFTSIFGIIGINSLLLYLVIGNRVFGHYCVLIFGLTFHYSLLFFVNEVPLLIARVSVITAMTTMLGAVLFTQSFIEFKKGNHPGWSKYYLILQWAIGSIIILQLLNILLIDSNGVSDILVYLAALLALIGTFSNFLVSAWLWKKTPLAKQYLLINIPMLVAGFAYTVLWFMLDSGNYQADILVRFIVSGGMAFQMILFSVFVGYKIKTAEKDKLDFKKTLIRNSRKRSRCKPESWLCRKRRSKRKRTSWKNSMN